MRRFATLIFYAVGAAAVAYLALYVYAMWAGRDLQPGAPIRIFKKPDAPNYSATTPAPAGAISGAEVSSRHGRA